MMKNAVVEGCTLELSSGSGMIQINTSPSTKGSVQGKGIYKGTMNISVSGFTSTNVSSWISGSGSGNGVIIGSSTKNMLEKQPILKEEDSCTITINGQKKTGSSTSPATDVITVKITNAGQSVMKVE